MLLEVKENCACILVEKSRQIDQFLPALKDLIIGLILEKCDQGASSNALFRFNVAYFSREPVFWSEQISPCIPDRANSAAQWIRSWSPHSRGEPDPISFRPHTVTAVVAAFNDPFVGAVYLLTASLPFESADDVINHVRYASKDRPVHVIFLTARSCVDESAMELLHQIARKTDGTFRVAYYSENGPKSGQLIEVPALSRNRQKPLYANESESSSAISPITVTAQSPPVQLANVQESPTERKQPRHFQKAQTTESFSDLIITAPKQTQERSRSIGRDIIIHLRPHSVNSKNRHSSPEYAHVSPPPNHVVHGEPAFRPESASYEEHENLDVLLNQDPELEDIKKEFVEFYWKRKKNGPGRNSPRMESTPKVASNRNSARARDPMSTGKSVDFEEPTTSNYRRVSTRSPVSSTSSSEDDTEDLLEKYSPKKAALPETAESEYGTRAHTPDTMRGNTSRFHDTPISSHLFPHGLSPPGKGNHAPITIHSKAHYTPLLHKSLSSRQARPSPTASSRSQLPSAKPSWIPATGRKHFVSSPSSNGRMGLEDRSRAWMNRWMNDWVNRHEPKQGSNQAHAAVQAEVDNDTHIVPTLLRSKSEPRKLNVTTYTQTPHEENALGEEMHTIRELLTHNNHLLNALSRSGNTARGLQTGRSPLQFDANQEFGRLNLDEKVSNGPSTGRPIAAAPPGSSRTTRKTFQQSPLQANIGHGPLVAHWDQGHKTRRDQLQSVFERKEEIRKQQADSCYKAMYQKMADDVSRRNFPENQLSAKKIVTNNGEAMEMIARLPYYAENAYDE